MSIRDDIVGNAEWGADNEPSIHYSQGSQRMAALDTPRALPLYTDCSAFVTLCYRWAGAPDPNGLGYNGSGFTGTLLGHLPQIGLADALPGDLIVYGPSVGDHVVIVIEPGPDPLCVSHGQEAGPIRVRHSVEARAHRAPFRVLRGLDELAPIPTPPTPAPVEDDQPVYSIIHATGDGDWFLTDLLTRRPVGGQDEANRIIVRITAGGGKITTKPDRGAEEWSQEDVAHIPVAH